MYTSLLCLMKPSQNGIEHKHLAKFCGGRGICTDVTSGAEKFTFGSRIRLRGTGYSWPGLFSGLWKFAGAQSLQYVYMDDDIIINYYIIMISF